MLSNKLSHRLDKQIAPFVRLLARFGVTANMLTVAGAITNAVAAATLVYGHFAVGGVLVLLGGTCDLLDGALARKTGQQSRFGAVLDSTLDRYSDVLPILGLMLYYSGWSENSVLRFGGMTLCGIVILGSLLVPYVRARAETIIEHCDVGIAERAERVLIFAAGLILNFDIPALWILAIITHATVIQRLWYVRAQLKKENQSEHGAGRPNKEEFAPSDYKGKL
jgi:CDP-diacylglycerol--glycerol-3-phosphate 3-phosphatidyltransferase